MSTPTLGPWYVANGPNYHIRSKEHGQVFPSGADGRLMAAAPDLLAALKYIEAVLDDATLDDCEREAFAAWQTARAAIAKATEGE